MSIKKIFKDGRAELRRKSSLRKSKSELGEKGKAYEVALMALGKKARDAKLDISQFGDLSGTLSQVEEQGKVISVKLGGLNKRTSELEEKKKAENVRFEALWKDLEAKKKPVDSELRSEKDKLEKAQKEADSIQRRLKNIPDEEEKIEKKIMASQGNAQAKAELEKRLTALKEEQKQLDLKVPELKKIIQAVREKITPLELQVGRLEAEMKKARDQHKKEIEDIDTTLSKVKGEINEFNKQQKAVSGQQVLNLQALGKKLSETNVADPAIDAEMNAVRAGEKDMASIRINIQTLEGQQAPGARGAVWKMAGLFFLLFFILAGIIVGLIWLTKHFSSEKGDKGEVGTADALIRKQRSGESASLNKAMEEDGIPLIFIPQRKHELTQEKFQQEVEKLEKTVAALESELNEIPRDTFEPKAIIDATGNDPERIFRWVRDNTYFIHYRGSLRGPIGVLMDRLGNSLDRSLLLAQFLETAGFEIRLAHAVLSSPEADDLQIKMRPVPENVISAADDESGDDSSHIERLSRQLEIEAEKLRQELDSAAKEEEQESRAARELVEAQTTMLADKVGKLLARGKDETNRQQESLRDHWWVQIKRQDVWQDLDPSLPDAEPGSLIASAKETCDLKSISEDQFHSLHIRVIAERWADGSINEKTALEQTIKVSDFVGRGIVLNHAPLNWPEDLDLAGEKDPASYLKTLMLGEKEWLPFLEIGSNLVFQSSINDAGEVRESPGEKLREGGVGSLGQGFLGGLAGGESKKEPKKKSYLTAEWIEYEIHTPGERTRTIRRAVFDLIGPAARAARPVVEPQIGDAGRLERGRTLSGSVDILPLVCRLSQDFVSWQLTSQLLERIRPLIEELKIAGAAKSQETAGKVLAEMHSLPGPLLTWALKRHQLGRFSNNVIFSSLNICNLRKQMVEDNEGRMLKRHTFDIIKNDLAPKSPAGTETVMAQLNQGVADTAAEAVLMFGRESNENTSRLASIASEQGIEWQSFQGPLSRDWTDWSKDVSARIRQDLGADYIVVIPQKAILLGGKKRWGWWRVDASNGETVGVMDTGLNQATSENFIVRKINYVRAVKTGRTVFMEDPAMLHSIGQLRLARYMGFQGVNGFVKRCYVDLLRALAGGL